MKVLMSSVWFASVSWGPEKCLLLSGISTDDNNNNDEQIAMYKYFLPFYTWGNLLNLLFCMLLFFYLSLFTYTAGCQQRGRRQNWKEFRAEKSNSPSMHLGTNPRKQPSPSMNQTRWAGHAWYVSEPLFVLFLSKMIHMVTIVSQCSAWRIS